MPNPRKQKITTNSFTKTKQVEKQTDWEWKTKQNRKEKEKCSVGWNDSATSYRALIILAIVIMSFVFTEENLSQLYSETSIKWTPN